MKTSGYLVKSKNDKGEPHSFNDKPAVEWDNWIKEWCKEGRTHRDNGPAVECVDGYKAWYKEGKRHRIDGPAIERSDGTKYWYYEGKLIECKSTEEFLKIINLKAFW